MRNLGIIFCAILITFVFVFAASFAQTNAPVTKLPWPMVAAPPTSFTAIQVLTPTGWIWAQPDGSIQIDTASSPPVIRAVTAAATEQVDTIVVSAATQSFSLSAAPRAGTAVKVYRNGLLMASTNDYALTGQTVTFVEAQEIAVGDIVQFVYWK
jgi:hypothetical protein